MLDPETRDALLLPPRTRLLHIGPMKTGTTSLQLAARGRRDELLAQGVRYPGTEVNHRRQLGAIMGWSVNTWSRSRPLVPDRLDVDKSGVPPRKDWDELKAEIDADSERRIFITHEYVSQVDDATARRIIDAIGEPIHICLTLRAPGQIVPSLWAQSVRDDAQTEAFESWVDRFFGGDPDHPISARLQRAYDQADLVERWARLVGPEHVTVIVVDKSDPGLLTGAFEAMLGLSTGTLTWKRSNASLSAVDAELFRHVNAILRDKNTSWSTFHNLVRYGAIKLGPERRTVAADEPRLLLPEPAADLATRDGERFADRIGKSGVRVVGDLGHLTATTPSAPWQPMETISVETAAWAVAGAILAGQQARTALKKELAAQTQELAALKAELSRAEQDREDPTKQLAGTDSAESGQQDHEDVRDNSDPVRARINTSDITSALKRRVVAELRNRRPRSLGRRRTRDHDAPEAQD